MAPRPSRLTPRTRRDSLDSASPAPPRCAPPPPRCQVFPPWLQCTHACSARRYISRIHTRSRDMRWQRRQLQALAAAQPACSYCSAVSAAEYPKYRGPKLLHASGQLQGHVYPPCHDSPTQRSPFILTTHHPPCTSQPEARPCMPCSMLVTVVAAVHEPGSASATSPLRALPPRAAGSTRSCTP